MERQIKREKEPQKIWAWGCCAVFCAVSGVAFFLRGDMIEGLICWGSLLLISIPPMLERYLHWDLNRTFFLFCVLYAMGPMLGKAFKLYYLTNWWDKLLHTSAGFLFAVFGTYLAVILNRGKDTSLLLQMLFGVVFSIAVSALWEMVEFGVDWIFGADMQNDTVVHAVHSYLLSDTPGVIFDIPQIQEVTVNETVLEIGGYLDIGLIDTMQDMLVETAGAAVFGLWHMADRNRHPLIRMCA